MADNTALPLARYSVLDLTRARAGPTCVRQLVDWGARAIKIEMPGGRSGDGMGGNRHGFDFQNLHRNKQAMTLNLREPEGVAIFKRLAKDADVVVENYRPDVKRRLGIDYESLRAINPRLIYGSISGFGQSGPYRDRPGVDQIAQGMGGLMSITGIPGQGPVRVGIPIADLCSGILLAQGILVALIERETTGRGEVGAHLAARGDALHARLPGLALADERRGPAPGRQQPPDRHSHRRVRDEGRPHQHRGGRRRDLRALLQGHRAPGSAHRSALRHLERALEEPRRADGGADAGHPAEDAARTGCGS